MELAKGSDRDTWYLVHPLDKPISRNGSPQKAKNCRYIIWKDKTVATFYTNDLKNTPREVVEGISDYTIDCVHGLAVLHRWTGEEVFHRTLFQTPAIIVAYNMFMNGVDRFDQMRTTNITMRREKRVPMSIFTFLVDGAIQNAHSVWNVMNKDPTKYIEFGEFKRRIAESLVTPQLLKIKERAALRPMRNGVEIIPPRGDRTWHHILLRNQNGAFGNCFLCKRVTRRKRKAVYFCSECKYAFHVNCFAFFHHNERLRESRPSLDAEIRGIKDRGSCSGSRGRTNKVHLDISFPVSLIPTIALVVEK